MAPDCERVTEVRQTGLDWQDARVIKDDTRPPSIELREASVDGVRVLHFPDQSGLTEATLIFGVGERDETLPTLGTLHALEHAVMTDVRRTPIDINGSVGVSTTQFTATGSSTLVSAFLAGICKGLADPPTSRLRQEARVLEAEGDGDCSGISAAAVARYGYRGLGLVEGPGPGPSGIRGDVVRSAAARWFSAANALLVVEGDWPEDLRLPLPDGARPHHPPVPIRRVPRPSAITVDGPACELNLILPAEPATLTWLTAAVLDDRLTEALRHERGLVYTVDVNPIRIPGGFDVTVRTDPTPDRVGDCVRAMVETVRTLVGDGPTEAEVAHAKAVLGESLYGRDAEIARIVDSAIDELIGLPTEPITLSTLASYDRSAVADQLRHIADDLLYVVDEVVEPDCASLGLEVIEFGPTSTGELPPGEVFRPPLVALILAKDARASRVALTSDGLTHAFDGRVQQVTWAEVAGVMRDDDGDLVVYGLDGQAVAVGPTLYKHGQRLVDAVLANVPGDLIYNAPADPDGTTDGRI